MHSMLWKRILWIKHAWQWNIQYFKFIGRIPHNCPEYNTCHTSKSMGRGGRSIYSSVVNLISSKSQGQGDALGTRHLSSHLQKGQGAARALSEEAGWISCRVGEMPWWWPCWVPIEHRAKWAEGRETILPDLICSILGQYLSHLVYWQRVLFSISNGAWGDDLLIPSWFLHPTLMESHSASLACLSLA